MSRIRHRDKALFIVIISERTDGGGGRTQDGEPLLSLMQTLLGAGQHRNIAAKEMAWSHSHTEVQIERRLFSLWNKGGGVCYLWRGLYSSTVGLLPATKDFGSSSQRKEMERIRYDPDHQPKGFGEYLALGSGEGHLGKISSKISVEGITVTGKSMA